MADYSFLPLYNMVNGGNFLFLNCTFALWKSTASRDADFSSFVIVASYLFSAAVLFLCKNKAIIIMRIVMCISIVFSSLMYVAFSYKWLALFFYIQVFCCVFMICGYILIVIEFFTPAAELKRISAAIAIYAFLACIMYHEGVKLSYSVFNAVAIVCQIGLTVFLFKLPKNPQIKYVKKDYKIKKPFVMTFGFILCGTSIAMMVCFASSIAESLHNGMSTYFFSMLLGAVFFAVWGRKMNMAKLFKLLILLMALGFACALASLALPGFLYAACAILGFAIISGEIYTYFGIFLFSRYPSRGLAPLIILFTIPAAVILMVLLELFRENLLVLYAIYGVISIAVVIIYLVFEPYFTYEFDHNSIKNTGENLQEDTALEEPKKVFDILSDQENTLTQLILQGYTESTISELMNITVNTQKSYRKSIYSKLNIHSKRELFELAEKQK